MEFECENMTPFGCPARDFAKELMLQEIIEDNLDSQICKKQCCIGCDESCGYRCGRTYRENTSEELEMEK